MTETTILQPGTNAAESAWVEVPIGYQASIGIFMEAGDIPPGYTSMELVSQTPGADKPVYQFCRHASSMLLHGPGAYRVRRNAGPHSAGATARVWDPTAIWK
ncbi:MAG TPA: hypothetical protein VNM48_01495 [Chloroflexota bacterium]|nr:hypothetical protein [Chloroflexota bacterium]